MKKKLLNLLALMALCGSAQAQTDVTDGIYYLYSPTAKGFIGRGLDYGTRAVIDGNGVPAQFTTDKEGKTTLKFIDNQLIFGFDGPFYTDVGGDNVRTFKISANAEGYYLMNTSNNKYLCAADGAVAASETAEPWKLCTLAERNAIVAEFALDDKKALAAKLGKTIATETEFTELLTNYGEQNKTAAIINPDLTDLTGWTKKPVRGDKVNTGAYGTEIYETAASLKQSVSGLEEGLYKVELYGYRRQGSNANCVAYAEYPMSSAYLQANSYKVHLNSWASQRIGDTNPNNTDDATNAFNEGRYLNTLYTYVENDGKLDLTIDSPGFLGAGWTIVYGLKLYKLSEKASAEEIADLQAEITKAEAYTIGFENGEYAPYNNITAITALAAAKEALAPAIPTKADVTAATEALKTATWTINEGEVNAVYNGDFALCENDGPMPGWTMSNNTLGGAYHARAFVGDARLAEFNKTNSAAFLRFDGTNSSRGSLYYYGDTKGYTMPLKAHTVYVLNVDVKGWGGTGKPIRLNLTGPTGFTAQSVQVTTTDKADNDDTAPQQLQITFYTGEIASDYKIYFQVPGSDDNKHNVVVSNISLKKLPAEDIIVSFKQEYGTLILPFAAEVQTGMEVYSVNSYAAGSSNVLKLDPQDKIEANTPYIVKNTTGAEANFTFNGVVYITDKTYEDGWLVGVLENTAAPESSYVLQKQGDILGFYQVVAGKGITVPAYRAYLKNAEAAANIQAFFFDDNDPTSATTAKTAAGTVDVYSINGILVRKDAQASQALDGLPKGLYIVNGKTKVVK